MKVAPKKVHVRIACPEIKFPDFYGVDMPTKRIVSARKNNQEMCEHIKAKSLKVSKFKWFI